MNKQKLVSAIYFLNVPTLTMNSAIGFMKFIILFFSFIFLRTSLNCQSADTVFVVFNNHCAKGNAFTTTIDTAYNQDVCVIVKDTTTEWKVAQNNSFFMCFNPKDTLSLASRLGSTGTWLFMEDFFVMAKHNPAVFRRRKFVLVTNLSGSTSFYFVNRAESYFIQQHGEE